MATLHVQSNDCSHTARIKKYPNGLRELLVCSEPIFRTGGWEPSGWHERPARGRRKPRQSTPANVLRAVRRARAQVRDLALCTAFRWFVTLTLDPAQIDRYDIAAVTRKLNNWLDNQVRRRGLAYVLVPELHKDGAIHFHGFFNDALEYVDSGHKDQGGHPIYNLPGWRLGFTTAIELYGDYEEAVGYVCKYIGKDQGGSCPQDIVDSPHVIHKIGGRWYYSGGDLGRPEIEYADIELRELDGVENAFRFQVQDAGLAFAQVRYRRT